MKINDFLMKKTTKYVFQVIRLVNEGNTVEYSKLGDSVKDYINVADLYDSFSLIPFLSDKGREIIKIRKTITEKQLEQFVVFDSKENKFTAKASFDLSDNIYNELKNELSSLKDSPATLKLNKDIQDKIKSFRTEDSDSSIVELDRALSDYDDNKSFHNDNNQSEEDSEEFSFNIISPTESDSMKNIIMAKVTKEKIESSLVKYDYGNFFDDLLSNETVKSNEDSLVLNLFGPPGTGKTISAKAFAHKLNKKILSVDFAQLISKMVGDTGKNIQKYFKKAKEDDLILFFDEADTLIQKRSSEGDSSSHHTNQNQNIFMRELDNFKGIVILTTNLFENYDEALLRRITNIPYPLPTEEMRSKIIQHHLPEKVKFARDVTPDFLASRTDGFSGGDIKNFIKDAIVKSANEIIQMNNDIDKIEIQSLIRKNTVSLSYFLEEIEYIYSNKKDYQKNKDFSRSKINLVA
jgi:SpoVK/Ycf46/Vps4 family AAA+-type ATPase